MRQKQSLKQKESRPALELFRLSRVHSSLSWADTRSGGERFPGSRLNTGSEVLVSSSDTERLGVWGGGARGLAGCRSCLKAARRHLLECTDKAAKLAANHAWGG